MKYEKERQEAEEDAKHEYFKGMRVPLEAGVTIEQFLKGVQSGRGA